MRKNRQCTLFLASMMLLPLGAWTATSRAEQLRLPFETTEYANQNNFPSGQSGTRLTLGATLYLPDSRPAKLPAVVIMHSAAGVQLPEREIAELLVRNGYAALLPERYARSNPQNADMRLNMAADSANALKAVASHPAVDARRIAILGISAGGTATILSNSELFQPPSAEAGLRYAAHVAFYPACQFATYGPKSSSGSPMLILAGEKDRNGPPQLCQDMIDLHRSTGTNSRITMKVFPDTGHAFLDSMQTYGIRNDKVDLTDCPLVVYSQDSVESYRSGKLTRVASFPAAYGNCRKRGTPSGYDIQAAAEGRRMALAFLREHLSQP